MRLDEDSDYYKTYVRRKSEKMANMIAAYVHNRKLFRDTAPSTFRWFDDFVNGDPELDRLSRDRVRDAG